MNKISNFWNLPKKIVCQVIEYNGKKLFAEVNGSFSKSQQPENIQEIHLFFGNARISSIVNAPWCRIFQNIITGQNSILPCNFEAKGTEFQMRVWLSVAGIAGGATVTYGELARQLSTSPRAIGNALGKNPLPIIIPCHRVVGQKGRMVGFSGGIDVKEFLLEVERKYHENSCDKRHS